MAEIKKLQENGTDVYPATLEDAVFDTNGTSIKDKYQFKTDDTLNTIDKTIVGAINEVFQLGNNVKQELVDALIAKDIEASTNENFSDLIEKISNIKNKDNIFPDWYYETRWITAANMPNTRYGLTSSVVGNKIYCIGGYNGSSTRLSTNEEYDPLTDTWTSKSNMPNTRYGLTSSVVGNKIYAIGGNGSGNVYLDTNECYIII